MKSRTYSLKTILIKTEKIKIRLKNHNIMLYASGSTLFICVSIIPFFILFISFARLFIPDSLNRSLILLSEIMPKGIKDAYLVLCDELLSKSSIPVISFSAVTILWSALKGFRSIYHGVSVIYGIKDNVGYIRNILKSSTLTFITMGILLLVLCIIIISVPIISIFVPILQDAFKSLFIFIILSLIFFLYYNVIVRGYFKKSENANIKRFGILVHLPGAVMSSSAWLVFSAIYVKYIESFSKFTYIYGSLTAIVMMMLIIYFGMIFFFLGAELNIYLINGELKKY